MKDPGHEGFRQPLEFTFSDRDAAQVKTYLQGLQRAAIFNPNKIAFTPIFIEINICTIE